MSLAPIRIPVQRENRAGEPERRDLRPAEMTDDCRVRQHVQGLRRERAERRQREPEDLAVVRRTQPHYEGFATGSASWLSTSATARSTLSSSFRSSTSASVSVGRWYSGYGKCASAMPGIFASTNGM